jgi:hypothetical protein
MEAFMNKLIQIGAILTLVVAFSAVAAFAGAVTRYDAQIPFAFNIGQKSYPAGTYVIRVTKISSSSGYLSLEDTKGNQLENVLVATSGEVVKGAPVFVFNRYENQSFLTRIATRDIGLTVPASKNEKQLVKGRRPENPKREVAVVAK